jgi:hypothetical protein
MTRKTLLRRNAESAKRWRKKNPKYIREWQRKTDYPRKWRAKNREKCLWSWARDRAKKKGIPFTISQADILIPKICPVLGIRLRVRTGKNGASNNSPTLDRVVPELGYTPGNIVVISWRANCLKRDATLEELQKLIDWLKGRIHGVPVQNCIR